MTFEATLSTRTLALAAGWVCCSKASKTNAEMGPLREDGLSPAVPSRE